MTAADQTSWQNPKVLTTLLLVFVAGALAGALSMRLGLHERIHPTSAGSAPAPVASKQFLDRCTKDLALSPQQAQQMALVLDDYKQYYQNIQDQFEDVRATGKNRIRQILTEEQRIKFEKMMSELK